MAVSTMRNTIRRAAVRTPVSEPGFGSAAPGHRFNLYFEVWNERWEIDDGDKANALRSVLELGDAAALLQGLLRRQESLAKALPEDHVLVVDARGTAPFATGLGIEHPIENGFAFLSPYGLPYLAGSGVKGILRRAAEELAKEGNAGLDIACVAALFGSESDRNPHRGTLTCWDVFPVPAGSRLTVEIMTPHYSHYYQQNVTPHDSGKPNPIPFLAVPAGSEFRFVVTFEPDLWPSGQPRPSDWKALLQRIFTHAFDWLGFGAKTALGYGGMGLAAPGDKQTPNAGAPKTRTASATTVREEVWPAARLTWNPGSGEIKASFGGRTTAGLKGAQATELMAALGNRAEQLKKRKELGNVRVRVGIEGNLVTLRGLDEGAP